MQIGRDHSEAPRESWQQLVESSRAVETLAEDIEMFIGRNNLTECCKTVCK